jgi:hypothetical protein
MQTLTVYTNMFLGLWLRYSVGQGTACPSVFLSPALPRDPNVSPGNNGIGREEERERKRKGGVAAWIGRRRRRRPGMREL